LPKVKQFLKASGGVDQYPDVKLEWIRHHSPELTIYEDGRAAHTVDLSKLDYPGLHTLFSQHFPKAGDAASRRLRGDGGNGTAALPSASAATLAAKMAEATSTSPMPNDATLPKLLPGRQVVDTTTAQGSTQASNDALSGFGGLSLALVGATISVALLVRRAARQRRLKQAAAAAASASGTMRSGACIQTVAGACMGDGGLYHVA